VAIDRGDDRANLSKELGAHHYLKQRPQPTSQKSCKSWRRTGGAGHGVGRQGSGRCPRGLRRGGVVISLGATDEPIEVSAFELLFKQLGVDGALTGTPRAGDATLRFMRMSDVAAMVETMPLERAAESLSRMNVGRSPFSEWSLTMV